MHTALMVMLVTAMFVPLMSTAQVLPQTQHGIVTSLSQLETEPGIRQYKEMYPALSAANFIYGKCTNELDISDTEQAYLKEKFTAVSKGYISAYQDAYVTYTQSSPPQSFLDDVVKALTKRQQDAVDNVSLVIRQRGCSDSRLRQFTKYVDSLRKQDKALKNAKPAEAPVPYK